MYKIFDLLHYEYSERKKNDPMQFILILFFEYVWDVFAYKITKLTPFRKSLKIIQTIAIYYLKSASKCDENSVSFIRIIGAVLALAVLIKILVLWFKFKHWTMILLMVPLLFTPFIGCFQAQRVGWRFHNLVVCVVNVL